MVFAGREENHNDQVELFDQLQFCLQTAVLYFISIMKSVDNV